MKKNWLLSTIIGIIFVSIIGTLMHFAYEWSGYNRFIGLFAPVNESTWEHMKLVFFPMLLYGFLESFFLTPNASQNKETGISILAGTGLIPVLFYTYRGVLGFGLPALDISTFYISVITAFYLRYRRLQSSGNANCGYVILALVLLVWIAFFVFTYQPPRLGIFTPPA